MPTLSIIVASCGRPSLAHTIESAKSQMVEGDEVLVSVNSDAPWGHRARNQLMPAARGDALLFTDDDDVVAEGALDAVRAGFAEAPDRIHMFRMRYPDGTELWQAPDVLCGNVSTQMVVTPRLRDYPVWTDVYEGDFHFISGLAAKLGPPVWHEQVIALIRPTSEETI